MKKIIISLSLFAIVLFNADAQVKFKLTKLPDGKTYQVSLISDITYTPPLNITSTAQITLKVPKGSVEINKITNLQTGVEWEPNSFAPSPKEEPNYDYISFNLMTQGTTNLSYKKGEELLLFTFQNDKECEGTISLMDNKQDPFSPPNSMNVNVGNQITVFGAKGDAYIGNAEKNAVPCGRLTDLQEIDPNVVKLKLYPNPAIEHINIEMDWRDKPEVVTLNIVDVSGKVVHTENKMVHSGKNLERVNVKNLSLGNYFVEMRGMEWVIRTEQFLKPGF